jgi:hypothetical protein
MAINMQDDASAVSLAQPDEASVHAATP